MDWKLRLSFKASISASEFISEDVRLGTVPWNTSKFENPISKVQVALTDLWQVRERAFLILAGFESYNFHYEVLQDLASGCSGVQAFWLRGKMTGSPYVKSFCVREMKGKWDLSEQTNIFGSEWYGGPTAGWKAGAPNRVIAGLFASA